MASKRERRAQRKEARSRHFQLGRNQKPKSPPVPREILLPVLNPILHESVMKLTDFGMPIGLARDLVDKGIPTIADLQRLEESDILEWPQYGPYRVRIILTALKAAMQ